MNKDAITINSIKKNFEIFKFAGGADIKNLINLNVNFDFKTIHNADIQIFTKEVLSEEEIKDKIVEVINS